MSEVDNAVRRSTRLRSGRSVLGELTNKKSGGVDGASSRNAKKPRLNRDDSSSKGPSSSSSTRDTERASVHSQSSAAASAADAEAKAALNAAATAAAATAASARPSSRSELPSHLDMYPEHVLVFDCDKSDTAKPHMATAYLDEIYRYYKDLERSKAPTLYMHVQNDINARMRAILIDWLVEVHLKFKLVPSTLYLCVTLIDQYCASNQVQRSKLQLVGVTALLVACKFEEIYPPEVRDCVYITDHAYTRDEVLSMEMKMLVFFGYNVASPSCYQFLVRFLRVSGYSLTSRTAHRASYFSERCLQEHEMLSYKPSLVAAAVVYLASSMDRADAWTPELREYSGYTLEQITPCARQISEHVNKNPITASKRPLHAVRKKFESSKFLAVAEESPPVL